jgi:hypothetical protein
MVKSNVTDEWRNESSELSKLGNAIKITSPQTIQTLSVPVLISIHESRLHWWANEQLFAPEKSFWNTKAWDSWDIHA